MLDFNVLFKIRSEAIESIKKDSEGDNIIKKGHKVLFFVIWYCIPISGIIIVVLRNIKLSDLESYIGASVALFTGLFFSLLLSLGDKLRTEKANTDIDQNNYLKFKENMKQISQITQFVILKGVLIFMLLLINSLFKSPNFPIIEMVFTCLSIYLLAQYTISILFLLQRFHHTMKDELNNTI